MTQSDSEIGTQLLQAFRETGFAVLIQHPINPSVIRTAQIAAEQLFSHTDEELLPYTRKEQFYQVGFGPYRCEKAKNQEKGDLKRYYHVRAEVGPDHPKRLMEGYLDNLWPNELEPGFKHASLDLYYQLEALGAQVLSLLGVAMGLPPQELPEMIVHGKTLLRLLHYPAVPGVTDGVRSAAHEDINLITLLPAASASGLQVQTKSGVWVPVSETPDSIVVNVGDMLQLYTDGQLKSTTHRVVNPEGQEWGERYSSPLFVHPRGEVVLDKRTGFTASQYLQQRLAQITSA